MVLLDVPGLSGGPSADVYFEVGNQVSAGQAASIGRALPETATDGPTVPARLGGASAALGALALGSLSVFLVVFSRRDRRPRSRRLR